MHILLPSLSHLAAMHKAATLHLCHQVARQVLQQHSRQQQLDQQLQGCVCVWASATGAQWPRRETFEDIEPIAGLDRAGLCFEIVGKAGGAGMPGRHARRCSVGFGVGGS